MGAGELRRNPLTGEWTIYAPARGARPGAPEPGRTDRTAAAPPDPTPAARGSRAVESAASPAERDPDCPFCPGNEDRLPEILLERGEPDSATWSVRVVRNRYPAVWPVDEASEEPAAEGRPLPEHGPYAVAPAVGRHEVIVESPRHDVDLPGLPPERLEAVVEVYRDRYADASRAGLRPVLFRNRGAAAGASQLHPHAQLVATAVRPPRLVEVQRRAARHLEQTGRCLFCEIGRFERQDGRRVLRDREGYLWFVPYAALPFESWILAPHGESFTALSPDRLRAFAAALGAALRALRDRADDPDYNLLVHARGEAAMGGFHWHVRIRPKLLTPAGLELAGLAVSPLFPEDAARTLAVR